jgi:DNA adenine methylase
VEPYAGGASLALSLLLDGSVRQIYLNDLDPAIYAFWKSILSRTDDFLELVSTVKVTPEEWYKQKRIYAGHVATDFLTLGFATFFLNRTSHSGILNAGMIGGKSQAGTWKLDARFNRAELVKRISRIASFKKRIFISQRDALDFLRHKRFSSHTLIYLDPPYFNSGKHLYLNGYKLADHLAVRTCVGQLPYPWIVSYEDVTNIRQLYRGVRRRRLRLLHTARSAHHGIEILYFSPKLRLPFCFLTDAVVAR